MTYWNTLPGNTVWAHYKPWHLAKEHILHTGEIVRRGDIIQRGKVIVDRSTYRKTAWRLCHTLKSLPDQKQSQDCYLP